MKRQFMPSNTSQGQQYQPEQSSNSDNWLLAGAGSDVPPASTRAREETPPQGMQRPASMGLLSGWKINQAQSNSGIGGPLPASVTEQSTVKQPTVQGPITGALWGNPTSQDFMAAPVSPHQSGIGPSSAIFPGGQSYPGFGPQTQMPSNGPISSQPSSPFVSQSFAPMLAANGAQSLYPFSSQPVQPQFGSPSQPLMPFAPASMPGQAQVGWQTGDQGGQPPLLQPPLPGQGGTPPGGPGKYKQKRRFPIWARVAVAALAVLIVLVGSGAYYYEANFAAPISNIVGQQAPLLKGEDNPNVSQNTANPLSGGRINILLLGSDTDQKFQGSYPLAQTDIVVTIDPTTKAVGMLSIPRDLYVTPPGFGPMKLDEVYAYGAKYLHNAVGLSRLTITQTFGIPINYYAWVGLDGFIKVVDTAGGVDIDATHPITDDIYPDDTGNSKNANAYKRLYIAPGPQHFDGLHALEYVRSRHADLVGDFGRSARQQQILSQLKTKLTSSPDIIGKLPQLAQDMNGFLKTDMNLVSIAQLMSFARTLDLNKIQRVILSPPIFSHGAKAPNGEDIFVANCAPIQQAIAKMFALGNKATCNAASANGTPIMTTATQQPMGPVLQAPSSNSWQTATQMASLSLGGSTANDFSGIHSLLDLLCLVVFESPLGLQV